MADFIDVVKSLKDNKTAADDGFSRLEKAISGTDSNSQLEEKAKQDLNAKKKEQGYFAKIGDEVSELNKNFLDSIKTFKSPAGALGGLLGLLVSPITLISGFLIGLADSFKALGKILVKTKLGSFLFVFINETLPNFFKKAFGKQSAIGKFLLKAKNIGRIMADPFFRLADDIKRIFKPNPRTASIIKDSIKFMMQPINMISESFKSITKAVTSGPFTKVMKAFTKVKAFMGTFGRILGRLFLPISFLMTAFDVIMGAIDGFTGTEGNIVQKLLGALGGAIKGLAKIITIPLDLVKDLISWVAEKFGFSEFSTLLDSFSFTELFGKAVDWLYVDLPAFFGNLFSWQGIKDTLSAGLDFVNEIGASLGRIIHKAINWVKGIFGFGDDSDFAAAGESSKFAKGLKEFLTFDFITNPIMGIVNFIKSIFDFDFMGFIKKLPGVGAILDFIGGDESNTVQDDGMKEQQERTKRMKELKKGLKEGSYDGVFTDSEDETAELKKLKEEEKAYFAKVRAGSADKGKLKTANLVGRKPTDGSDFKDVDPSEMTSEQLKAAMIDYENERNKRSGGSRSYFDRKNQKLRRSLSRRSREFRVQAEEENNMGQKMTQAQIDRIGNGTSGNSTTIVNNTNNSPVNNNSSNTTFSPLTQVDPVTANAINSGP